MNRSTLPGSRFAKPPGKQHRPGFMGRGRGCWSSHGVLGWVVVITSVVGCGVGSHEASAGEIVENLRPGHPRLMVDATTWERIRERARAEPAYAAALGRVVERARLLRDRPPLERQLTGRRMLSVSREALQRLLTLSVAYHATGEAALARRAAAELQALVAFEDWNPSHFLDVAEMAAAVSIGYDWLYQALPEATRQAVRDGLRRHAFEVLPESPGWMTAANNWNQVCFSGLTLAALAVAEHDPQPLRRLLPLLDRHHPRGLTVYAPDGVYPEGPSYWGYGTAYEAMLIDSLESALGGSRGFADAPGLLESGRFMAQVRAPSGTYWNYADGLERSELSPALLWVAGRANRLSWLASDHQERWDRLTRSDSWLSPLALIWWPEWREDVGWPELSWRGGGETPLAVFRSGWGDPSAMYLGVKGGSAGGSHAHMDAGSFVFEAAGVRWSIDPGRIDYQAFESLGLNIFDRRPEGDRWKVLNHVNRAHSTLEIDGKPFAVTGHADLESFEPWQADAPSRPGGVTVRMSAALGDLVEDATRRFLFEPARGRIEVRDQLTGLRPGVEVCWTLTTRAQAQPIAGDPSALRLLQQGKALELRAVVEGFDGLNESSPGHWEVEPWDVPESMAGPDMPGVSWVRYRLAAPAHGRVGLTIVLTSEVASAPPISFNQTTLPAAAALPRASTALYRGAE